MNSVLEDALVGDAMFEGKAFLEQVDLAGDDASKIVAKLEEHGLTFDEVIE